MIVGIIPAAGHATRMNNIPKFVLPIPTADDRLIDRHVNMMQRGGVDECFIGTRGDFVYALHDPIKRTYTYEANTKTMSETVLMAKNDVALSEIFAFGMPDTFIEDFECYTKLLAPLTDIHSRTDLTVGLFYTRPDQRHKLGMVRLDSHDNIVEIMDKPTTTDLVWAWGTLAWKTSFWKYIKKDDPHVGYAIPRAIMDGLHIQTVKMVGGMWDCGTPIEYFDLINHLYVKASF